jgi:hypothetical protein
MVQPNLIDLPGPLSRICLVADSPRQAYYQVEVIHLAGAGYISPPYQEMDKVLQSQRVSPGGGKQTYRAPLESLSAGTMVELDGAALLIWRGRLYRWAFAGYSPYDKKVAPSCMVNVLTPESIARTFARGFIPEVHVSAYW